MSATKVGGIVKGYFAASLATLIIGFSFMFVKLALENGSPLAILSARFNIAFIAMLPIAFIKRKDISLSFSKIRFFIPIAILYPVFFFCLQILGMDQELTSSEAGVVQSTMPIFIMFLAFFFLKEKIRPVQILFSILSVVGVLVILFSNGIKVNISHAVGLFFILGSVLSGSINNILIRKHRSEFSVIEITFFSTFLGFVVFNTLYLVSSAIKGTSYTFFIKPDDIPYTISLLYLGILSSLGTSFFTNYALSKIPASKYGVFNNLVIVVAILAGAVFMDERLTVLQLTGAFMIFIGVVGTNIVKNR